MEKQKQITAHTRDFSCAFHQMFPLEPAPNSTPIYSFERPARIFWSAFVNGMMAAGMTEQQAKDWVGSSAARHCLDQSLGDALADVAFAEGRRLARAEGR